MKLAVDEAGELVDREEALGEQRGERAEVDDAEPEERRREQQREQQRRAAPEEVGERGRRAGRRGVGERRHQPASIRCSAAGVPGEADAGAGLGHRLRRRARRRRSRRRRCRRRRGCRRRGSGWRATRAGDRPSPGAVRRSASGRRLAQPRRRRSGRRPRAAARSRSRRSRRRSGCAGARRSPAGVPTWAMRPSLKTATWSAIDSASPWSWVTKTKVMPSRVCSAFSSSCIASRSLRSSAPSGSSSSSTRGRLTSARASATRWRWPPESCAGLAVAEAGELDERQHLLGRARGARPCGTPRDHRAVGDVVADVEVREERVVLEDGVDAAPVRRHAARRPRRRCGCGRRSAGRSRRSAAGRWSCPSPKARAWRRTRPRAIARSTPSTARTSPKWRETSSNSTASGHGGGRVSGRRSRRCSPRPSGSRARTRPAGRRRPAWSRSGCGRSRRSRWRCSPRRSAGREPSVQAAGTTGFEPNQTERSLCRFEAERVLHPEVGAVRVLGVDVQHRGVGPAGGALLGDGRGDRRALGLQQVDLERPGAGGDDALVLEVVDLDEGVVPVAADQLALLAQQVERGLVLRPRSARRAR